MINNKCGWLPDPIITPCLPAGSQQAGIFDIQNIEYPTPNFE